MGGRATPQISEQDTINGAVYQSPGVYRYYLSRELTPSEIACFSKYSSSIFGCNVLDIGVGAGRTTHHLAPLAGHYEAIDFSPVMVAYMRRTAPHIPCRQANFRDLSAFEEHSVDFVLATDNVIDALSHEDRLRALREAARVLRRGGFLGFSAHNLNYNRAFSDPRLSWSPNPVRFSFHCARFARSWWNHIRVRKLRRTSGEYALLNDPGHFYGCLHYYASRATVESQLATANLRLRDVFGRDGVAIPEGGEDQDQPSLFYVAERV